MYVPPIVVGVVIGVAVTLVLCGVLVYWAWKRQQAGEDEDE